MPSPPSIPGPSRLQLLRALPRIHRDLTRYLAELAAEYGDTVLLPLPNYPTYLLRHPADIKHILLANYKNYHKAGGLRVGGELLGKGLVTNEQPDHLRQRRLMQPMFHNQVLEGFADTMTGTTEKFVRRWKQGAAINLSQDMMELTLSIVGLTLFSADLSGEARDIGQASLCCQTEITRFQRGLPLPRSLRVFSNRRYKHALKLINDYMLNLMRERRTQASPPKDVLSLLLAVRHDDGSAMSDQQIRDETVTLLVAGHETVSNALTWTFLLLGKHPEALGKLRAEFKEVLGGRIPAVADIPKMPYLEKVMAESMRLYPPAWTLARRVLKEDLLPSGLKLPGNTEVIMTQFVSHRNPQYFPDPERFDPERFDPATKKEWPQFVYYPFGAGPRYCIGEAFARMEMALLLATILPRFNFKLLPGQDFTPEPLITLRPKHGVKVEVEEMSEAQ